MAKGITRGISKHGSGIKRGVLIEKVFAAKTEKMKTKAEKVPELKS